ncbi:hypothetical protein K439DRAFT_485970 [Ramaria rubella]|nr:hypothetical protein K439DRAFT_485970 [Ramaria rubella]
MDDPPQLCVRGEVVEAYWKLYRVEVCTGVCECKCVKIRVHSMVFAWHGYRECRCSTFSIDLEIRRGQMTYTVDEIHPANLRSQGEWVGADDDGNARLNAAVLPS